MNQSNRRTQKSVNGMCHAAATNSANGKRPLGTLKIVVLPFFGSIHLICLICRRKTFQTVFSIVCIVKVNRIGKSKMGRKRFKQFLVIVKREGATTKKVKHLNCL